nr:unnamed protein product [Digitaria exilis]
MPRTHSRFPPISLGVVAKAQNVRTGAKVAIKWIRRARGHDEDDEPIAHAFMREASCLAAHRDHPGVVQLKNVATDTDTGDLYIVMELGGPTLRSRLITRPFTEDETRDAMRQLFGAVEKLHATGMIHNDINPDNILVARDGTLKICGFGCATPARPPFAAGEKEVKTRLGTLQYRSPEQLNGSQCSGPKDDIWALGCVMAERVSGEPLITAATEEDALDAAVDVGDDICI